MLLISADSLDEAQHMLAAQVDYRRTATAKPGDDLVSRILSALKTSKLPQVYDEYFTVLYKTSDYRDIRSIAADLNAKPAQIGAMASKLSARLKKVATSTELRDLATPLHLLVSIRYAPGTKEASHKLTDPAGRAAVARYLKLA